MIKEEDSLNNLNDQYLYINWEDNQQNTYRVGILARISNTYYLKTYVKKSDYERDAYSHGYIGIPGFIPGRLYMSTNQLFDFFKRRVFAPNSTDNSIDFLEKLKQTNGVTLTDSFSIEEMPEKYRQSCKNILLSLSSLEKEKSDFQK